MTGCRVNLRDGRGCMVLDWGRVVGVRPDGEDGAPVEVLVRWRETRRESWWRIDDPRIEVVDG
jgi:hypothetical protein